MTDQNNESAEISLVCPECKAGVMRLRYLTYFTWLDDELITVPNFPAWVCDMCGRREYDARAVNWLNTLLNPATGRKTASPRKSRPSHLDHQIPRSPNEQ